MDPRAMRRITLFDILLILAVVLSAVVFLARFWRGSGERAVAQVFQDGRLVEVLPLDRDRVVDVTSGGSTVRIEVRDDRIRILESDCPKRICVRAGWIGRPGQTVVCVPRKLMIQITGVRQEHDAETY